MTTQLQLINIIIIIIIIITLKYPWNFVTHYGSVQPHNGGVPSSDRTVQRCKRRTRDGLLRCLCLKENCARVQVVN